MSQMQLQPIYDNMPYEELLKASQRNFAVLLDAYANGSNAVFFKGQAGANGAIGTRGASLLHIRKNNVQSAVTTIDNTVQFETVYASKAMLQQYLNDIMQNDEAVTALFNDFDFINSKTDLVNLDTILIDNGYMFILKIDGDNYTWEASSSDMLMTGTFEDLIAELVESHIERASDVWQKNSVGVNTSYIEGATNTGPVMPAFGDYANYPSLAWLAITSVPGDDQHIVFVGNNEQLNNFFSAYYSDSTKKASLPSRSQAPAMIVNIRNSADKGSNDTAPAHYGLVLLDSTVNGNWGDQIADICYRDGRLWLSAQPNKGKWSGTDKQLQGRVLISKELYKVWVHDNDTYIELTSAKFKSSKEIEAPTLHLTGGTSTDTGIQTTVTNANALKTDENGKIVKAEGSVANPVPIGTMVMWPGDSVPNTDWMFCQGQTLKRADYPDLFAVLGTKYNVGSVSSSNFKLPDMRGRVAIGAGQGDSLTSRTLASRGGTETVSLTVANIPAHYHDMEHRHAFDHKHTISHTHRFDTYTGWRKNASSPYYSNDVADKDTSGEHQHRVAGTSIKSDTIYTSDAKTSAGTAKTSTDGPNKAYTSGPQNTSGTSTIWTSENNQGHYHSLSGDKNKVCTTSDGAHSHRAMISWNESGQYLGFAWTGDPSGKRWSGYSSGEHSNYKGQYQQRFIETTGEHTHALSGRTEDVSANHQHSFDHVHNLQSHTHSFSHVHTLNDHVHKFETYTGTGGGYDNASVKKSADGYHNHPVRGTTQQPGENNANYESGYCSTFSDGTVKATNNLVLTSRERQNSDSAGYPEGIRTGNGYSATSGGTGMTSPSTAHENMQPWLCINFIIKVKHSN